VTFVTNVTFVTKNLLMDLAIILSAIGIATIAIIYFTNRRSADSSLAEWLRSMDKRIDNQTSQMLQAQQAIYSELSKSAKSIGEMSEIGKSMKDLQQFLASPKLRGGIGEQVLKQLLEESLPKNSFNLQYTFRSGNKVDAAIKTDSGIIPIDSKFTMENFKKMMSAETDSERMAHRKLFIADTKDRVDEISRKYILTDEGTVDFALMYVPSESVYYEIVNSEDSLMDYAYKRRVMPVSPSTFYAFLRSVLLSFEGQQIAAEIKNIQNNLRAIHTETSKFAELLSTLQTHVNNTYSMMSKVSSQFSTLSSKVDGVQGIGKNRETRINDLPLENTDS